MRHGKKFNHLGRKHGHRKALMRNLASALIRHKRINTTLAKAKALRVYVEPLVTKAKSNTTHARRVVFSYLQDKEAVKELFETVRLKVGDRPGGYVRVLKTGFRQGDGAEMAMIELVDFNEIFLPKKVEAQEKTETRARRTRRGGRRRHRDTGQGAATAASVPAALASEEE